MKPTEIIPMASELLGWHYHLGALGPNHTVLPFARCAPALEPEVQGEKSMDASGIKVLTAGPFFIAQVFHVFDVGLIRWVYESSKRACHSGCC